MKEFKKLITLFLAVVMVLAMSVPAMAAELELTQEPAAYQDSHTYNVYQVFTGTIGTDENGKEILQNVKYGANFGDTGASVPKDELDAVGTDARAYAARLLDEDTANGEVAGTPVATLNKANGFKVSGLADGYYLVVDTVDGSLEAGDALSTYIVQVLGTTSMATKKDVTESNKKITSDDHPATEGGDANPGVSGDGKVDNVSVGDTVTFEITAKVPSHATDYDFYYFIINDTLSEGLTFGEVTSVKVGDTEMKKLGSTGVEDEDAEYALYTGEDTDAGHTFEVALLKANTAAFAGKTITVTYTATLNKDAVIGGDGNLNTETVSYSNNPNSTYDGTQDEDKPGKPADTEQTPLGETPESTTQTFTSGIKLQKLDQDGKPLSGASFTIEGDSINKVVKNSETFAQDASGDYWKLKTGAYTTQAPQTEDQMIAAPAGATDGYVVWQEGDSEEKITVGGVDYRVVRSDETPTHILQKNNAALYDSTTTKYKKSTTETVEETTEHKSQELPVNPDGTLNFKGLGAGTYTIKETVVPEGYTKAEDVTVVITFNNTTKQFTATVNGTAATAVNNLFPVDVVNVAGNALPETGGIGTIIFYVLGSLLVVGCGIILISKRRINADK